MSTQRPPRATEESAAEYVEVENHPTTVTTTRAVPAAGLTACTVTVPVALGRAITVADAGARLSALLAERIDHA